MPKLIDSPNEEIQKICGLVREILSDKKQIKVKNFNRFVEFSWCTSYCNYHVTIYESCADRYDGLHICRIDSKESEVIDYVSPENLSTWIKWAKANLEFNSMMHRQMYKASRNGLADRYIAVERCTFVSCNF